LSLNFITILGCASGGTGTQGFQKEYPWTFVPFTKAPWIYQFSFDDVIDLSPIIYQNKITNLRKLRDSKSNYPINELSQSLNSYN